MNERNMVEANRRYSLFWTVLSPFTVPDSNNYNKLATFLET